MNNSELTANRIVELSGMHPATIRKRLAKLTPCRKAGSWKYYDAAEALRAVYEPDGDDEPGALPSKAHSDRRRAAAEADLAEIKRDNERGRLISVKDAMQLTTRFVETTKHIIWSSPLPEEERREILENLVAMKNIDWTAGTPEDNEDFADA